MGLQGLRLPARANTGRPFYHRSNSNEENLYYYSFENSIIVSNAHKSLWKYRSRYYNDLSLNFHAVTGPTQNGISYQRPSGRTLHSCS